VTLRPPSVTVTTAATRRLRLGAIAAIAAVAIGTGMMPVAHAADSGPSRAQHGAVSEGGEQAALQTDLALVAGLLLLTGAIVDMRVSGGGAGCHCDDKH
jgi:hypothetical protein